ncbi:MAG: HutD family protein [Eubacteriales bacterium]|nr:HutD family protein [Eubacteriales bacterium]
MEKYEIKKLKDIEYSTWQGGKTYEIAIGGGNKDYKNRDFLWRVSSATCDLEESEFSDLTNYSRFLTTLDKPIKLEHFSAISKEKISDITLEPFMVHNFDGEIRTVSHGKCKDFNLMTKKLDAFGSMIVENKNNGGLIILDESEHRKFGLKVKQVVFIASGGILIRETNQELNEEDFFVSNGEIININATKDNSNIIICTIIIAK